MAAGLAVTTAAPGVAVLTLRNPDQLNALTDAMVARLRPQLEELDADPAVRVVVVTGEGRGFCSGAALGGAAFTHTEPGESERFMAAGQGAIVQLRRMATPSIAAVSGPAVGAGFGLAMACDLRVADATAYFKAAFVELGLVPDFGLTWTLPRVVGTDRALEILLGGERIEAEAALQSGLVTRLAAEALPAAVELATRIAACPPDASRITRHNVYRGAEASLEAVVLGLEVQSQSIALHSAAFRERFAALQTEGGDAADSERKRPG